MNSTAIIAIVEPTVMILGALIYWQRNNIKWYGRRFCDGTVEFFWWLIETPGELIRQRKRNKFKERINPSAGCPS